MHSSVARMRDDVHGFTLVETLVAAVVLILGLMGTFAFLAATVAASFNTRAREGAVTLARQITEDARSIPFTQLSPGTITAQLQAMPGLANQGAASTWQIQRRNITYTINATECSVDDAKDGYGAHDGTFCADSSKTGTADAQPVDFKRVTVDVRWAAQSGTHDVREVATMSSAGQPVALTATNLQLSSPSVSNPTSPTITSPTITQLQFQVSAPVGTAAIVWTINGSTQNWSATHSGTTWTSSAWPISGLSDGTYQVGAQAEDANGVVGPAVTIPVRLVRSVPSAPKALAYGFNTNLYLASQGKAVTAAELQWQANPELNVSGYRLYDPSGQLICTTSNSTSNYNCGGTRVWCSTPTSCIDFQPPATTASNLTYQVAALYYDSSNTLQQGPTTAMTLLGQTIFNYTFAPSANNTGNNCSGASTLQDMLSTYTPGATTTKSVPSISFCSNGFVAGQQITSGGTASIYAGTNGACSMNATYSINGNQYTQTAPTQALVKTVQKYTFTFPTNQPLTMNAGDRIVITFSFPGGCNNNSVNFGSATYPSAFSTPLSPIATPGTPTGLTLTTNSDGSATLNWTPATNGAAVSAYRIYRGGHDYTNRYDTVDPSTCSSTCSWTDNHRSGSTSYYVTAVGSTTLGADMAESPATGGVNG